MDYLRILLSTLTSLLVLFLLAKIIGNRQMSELTVFDYINGITIGSIAAEMATSLEQHWTKPMLSMIIYGLSTALISFLCCKSLKIRRVCYGKAIILFDKGKFRYGALKRARLDINEFLALSRVAGYFDLSELQTAVMEQNGKISFLPKAEFRPATPKDFSKEVPDSSFSATIIIDGNILEQNLLYLGLDKKWLFKEIAKAGAGTPDEILLATVDSSGNACFYKKYKTDNKNDIFM